MLILSGELFDGILSPGRKCRRRRDINSLSVVWSISFTTLHTIDLVFKK